MVKTSEENQFMKTDLNKQLDLFTYISIAIIFSSMFLCGCVSRQRYLDYGIDCRDNGYQEGYKKANIECSSYEDAWRRELQYVKDEFKKYKKEAQDVIFRLSSRLSKLNYEFNKLKLK